MELISDPAFFKSRKGSVGLVPTMGALHEGHLSLIREAKQREELVVVSIFVNPTQFGPNEDYLNYPRQLEQDMTLAEKAGADAVFVPTVETIYPNGVNALKIKISGVTENWEGAARPCHFEGVATVVARLILLVCPDNTYFGQKDLQQTLVVKKMHSSLGLPGGIQICPISREPDGLARSSRNVFLTSHERKEAPLIYKTLDGARQWILEHRNTSISETFSSFRNELNSIGLLDYFELVSLKDLNPLDQYHPDSAIITAVRVGKVRLLDNVLI